MQVLESLAARAQVLGKLLTPRQPRLAPERPAAGEILRLDIRPIRRAPHEPLAELALDRDDAPRLAVQHDVARRRIALDAGRERLLEAERRAPRAEAERRDERRGVARAPVIEHVRDERGGRRQSRDPRRPRLPRRKLRPRANAARVSAPSGTRRFTAKSRTKPRAS